VPVFDCVDESLSELESIGSDDEIDDFKNLIEEWLFKQ
jgi:hypothetical protein